MLTIAEAKSGETRSFVLNRQFCLDMFIVFSKPLLPESGVFTRELMNWSLHKEEKYE
ncbi:hypothetical protein [Bacillus sonorensis]|nr:hypothetical protein [Bacillus sonorensis]MCY8604616.1 hypothetical protein [Bacillus sonorensis]